MHAVFEAIGTSWEIDIYSNLPGHVSETALLREIHNKIDEYDQTYSRFREDSLVTAISKNKGSYTFPQHSQRLFTLYKTLYDATDGAFTPLIGNALSDAGYDAKYSLKLQTMHVPPSWDEAIHFEYPVLSSKKNVLLDFGAGGKGYLVELISSYFIEQQIESFCIDAGGDIFYQGNKPLRIGLEHPGDPSKVIGVAEINNASICGSAGNRRKWGNFHHMIDPTTLTSPTHIVATWVVAESGLVADALATALYFSEAKMLQQLIPFEYLKVFPDYSIERSVNFPAEIFLSSSQEPAGLSQ